MAMHDDELIVSTSMVRELLRQQFPGLVNLPIRKVDSSGTVNAIFRIGDEMSARFALTRRSAGDERQILEAETQSSREFAAVSPFPSPLPIAVGEPGSGYPLPWSLQTWIDGTVALDNPAEGSAALAKDLATLIITLREVDTAGRTFDRGGRGGDLRNHDAWVQTCLLKSSHALDVPRLAAMWATFADLPRTLPDVMSHGDLTSGNILLTDGRLSGVLDCGGYGAADPALDLIAAWHLLDRERRQVLRGAVGVDDLDWERGKAWAFEQAIGLVWYYERSNPAMSEMGRRALRELVDDHS